MLGVVVVGEHRVYEANDAYLAIIGYSRDDLEAGRIAWRTATHPGSGPALKDKAIEQLRRTGACQPFEKEYVHQGRAPGAGPGSGRQCSTVTRCAGRLSSST